MHYGYYIFELLNRVLKVPNWNGYYFLLLLVYTSYLHKSVLILNMKCFMRQDIFTYLSDLILYPLQDLYIALIVVLNLELISPFFANNKLKLLQTNITTITTHSQNSDPNTSN